MKLIIGDLVNDNLVLEPFSEENLHKALCAMYIDKPFLIVQHSKIENEFMQVAVGVLDNEELNQPNIGLPVELRD
jgi:hypothetical protein